MKLEMNSGHLNQALSCPKSQQQQQQQQEKKPRPHPEQSLKCPRCDSTNTKFCYYNNYSLSQPRYFCKGCRRYWTKGGSLRNVPVGGGCRKNKRTSSNSSSKKSQEQDLTPNPLLPSLPPLSFDPNDLSLAFANDSFMLPNPNPSPPGFLDILRNGLNNNRTNPSEPFQTSMYYGLGDNAVGSGDGLMMLPFDGGIMSAVTATASAIDHDATTSACEQGSSCKSLVDQGDESKMVMGLHSWAVGGDHHHGNNLGLDSAREYWNGVGTTNWHGLVNSSLM